MFAVVLLTATLMQGPESVAATSPAPTVANSPEPPAAPDPQQSPSDTVKAVKLPAAGTTAAPVPAEAAAPAPGAVRLVAGTEFEVELTELLSSRTSKLGDKFAIRLAAPVVVDGVEVVPAGAVGQGEVIDVASAGLGGKQGKLIVAARHLELNGVPVRVRGMTFTVSGTSRVDMATVAVIAVGAVGYFIQGGNIEIPAGTRATVRLAKDVDLPPRAPSPSIGEQQ